MRQGYVLYDPVRDVVMEWATLARDEARLMNSVACDCPCIWLLAASLLEVQ